MQNTALHQVPLVGHGCVSDMDISSSYLGSPAIIGGVCPERRSIMDRSVNPSGEKKDCEKDRHDLLSKIALVVQVCKDITALLVLLHELLR